MTPPKRRRPTTVLACPLSTGAMLLTTTPRYDSNLRDVISDILLCATEVDTN